MTKKLLSALSALTLMAITIAVAAPVTDSAPARLRATKAPKSSVARYQSSTSPHMTRIASGQVEIPAPGSMPGGMRRVDGQDLDLRGCVTYSDNHRTPEGINRIPTTGDGTFSLLAADINASHGGVEVGGVYYAAYALSGLWGGKTPIIKAYDSETWQELTDYSVTPTIGMLATDVAYDPTTGKVYGCYYTDADDGTYEFATMDYATGTRTAICSMEQMNAMAVDGAGTLYGINMSGNLYKIDKGSGALTLVGSTGVRPNYVASAAIDPATGRMFWSVANDYSARLCEVNTTTGQASTVLYFANSEEITGMYFPAPKADPKAPAAVENPRAEFAYGSMSGNVCFTAPSTLFDGSAASGSLTYTVSVNNRQVATGTTQYGAEVSVPVTVTTTGMNDFTVVVSNTTGDSPKARFSAYIGTDTPKAPENITAAYADGTFTVTWNPVTSGVGGATFDASQITYTVKRIPGDVTVAEGISATTCTDAVPEPDQMTAYHYEVSAKCGDDVSAPGLSNDYTLGSMVPPYSNSFDNSDALTDWTVIDANGDGKLWEIYSQAASYGYTPSSGPSVDDWLITPAMRYEAGSNYTISFDVYVGNGSYPERLEVKYGNAPTAGAMTGVLLEPTTMTASSSAPQHYEFTFSPETSGKYYIGFHGMSDPDMFRLYLDNFSVSAPSKPDSPSPVSELTVTADPMGALQAEISFKAPDKTIDDTPLTQLTAIQVSRDGTPVKSFENPEIGGLITFTDAVPAKGTYTYSVVAMNGEILSTPVEQSVFIGVNAPGVVTSLKAVETANPGEVTLSWEAPLVDCDGLSLNPALVTYNVYELAGGELTLLTEGLAETTYTFRAIEADAPQQFKQWVVGAVTDGGISDGIPTAILPLGPAYTMPYAESFSNAETHHIHAYDLSGGGDWQLFVDEGGDIASQDEDGGFLGMYGNFFDENATIYTGKITLSGKNPTLLFWVFPMDTDDENRIEVSVVCGGQTTVLREFAVNTLPMPGAWNLVGLPLAEFAGKDVQIALKATTKAYTYTAIDNIRIQDVRDANMSLTRLQAPAKVDVKTPFALYVTVTNEGMAKAADYTVDLYRNGEKVASQNGPELESMATSTLLFTQSLDVLDEAEHTYRAEIIYDSDEVTDDNVSRDVTVILNLPGFPTVEGLKAERPEDGTEVTVSWNEPLLTATHDEMTEDFESGKPFAQEFEGWTFVDGDNLYVGAFGGIDIPGLSTGMNQLAWFLFDASHENMAGKPEVAAHSGDKYLASIYGISENSNNDWAISPMLPGTAQTISFFARSFDDERRESIQVLYSTGSLTTTDFIALGEPFEVPGTWTEFSFELPEGARYFAIRYCSAMMYMIGIDDVTFTPYNINADLEVTGYNVYRNRSLLTATPVSGLSFTDTGAPAGENTYAVTAVYDKGESVPEYTGVTVTALRDAVSGAVTVTAVDGGILVRGAAGEPITVYAPDGRTVLSVTGTEATFLPLPSGLYLVKAASTTAKIRL